MTLTHAAFGQLNLTRQVALVLGASLLIAIAAQISVPFWPVPLTLQTLAVLTVGFALGARLASIAILVYLAEGAMGLPVFAKFFNGAAFFGPTAGFLVGFVLVAWIAGTAADRGIRNFWALSGVALVASAVLYIPGLAWPMFVASVAGLEGSWIGQDFGAYYWAYFVQPFLIGDVVKALLAALIVTGGWAALRR
ncbi:MAG: biotin transporter BioY [Marinovum sp.]|nr:biotin transporter BioY [Marinovum sp.]